MHTEESSTPEPDGAATNTLVLQPTFDADSASTCGELLGVAEPGETNALFVTLTGTPDSRLDHWRRHVSPQPPANVGVVTVDEGSRSASASTSGAAPTAGGAVRSVSSSGDLTGLGIAVSEYLDAWEGNGHRTVVCFDSLTPLLQYVDRERAFQFLHVLTRRVASVDAVAHYHMDPEAHDERTVRTIASLFDRVVDAREPEEEHEQEQRQDREREDPAPAESVEAGDG